LQGDQGCWRNSLEHVEVEWASVSLRYPEFLFYIFMFVDVCWCLLV
jgi:hypothetical protein